ncbi:MAG: ubiquinol-cytochrome c reductase iron-sulfur subunit [Chitinophagaceae bacterium]
MDRRKFIKSSCTACLSVSAVAVILSSCKTTRYASGKLITDGLLVNTEEFKLSGAGDKYRSFIIIRNDSLQYPLCVYRFSDTEYTALWMRCTHQGTELQASGDFLQCPAHGSEFNNKGKITNGPADKDLRSFPVTVNKNELFIDLRKVV